MTAAAVLAEGQSFAEELMTDACTIVRVVGKISDPVTGAVTDDTVPVYEGKCRLQKRGLVGRDVETGEQPVAVATAELQLPAATTGVAVDDIATVSASATTAALVGTRWRVDDATPKTHQTKLACLVQSITAEA